MIGSLVHWFIDYRLQPKGGSVVNTEKSTQKVVHKSTGDIVKSSSAETAPKNKAAQRLIQIIEQPTPVTDEDVKSLIKVIKESRGNNVFRKFKDLKAE